MSEEQDAMGIALEGLKDEVVDILIESYNANLRTDLIFAIGWIAFCILIGIFGR